MSRSDGSTASYYRLPQNSTELQDLISERNMNAQIGEIFRACYRFGQASHSNQLRDAKKIRFYAMAEVERLERLENEPAWPEDERIDLIGANGNGGEHYKEPEYLGSGHNPHKR